MLEKQLLTSKKQNSHNSFLTRNIKEFNVILLILIGLVLISISGYSSYAIFSSETSSSNKITGTVKAKEISIETPLLSSNMIPVYFDSSDNAWKKADSTNPDNSYKWYDYGNKMWANAVTVSPGASCSDATYTNQTECEANGKCVNSRYTTESSCRRNGSTWTYNTWTSGSSMDYKTAAIGTTIPVSEINTMWVWIPRYKYTYFKDNASMEEIKISFEKGTSSTGTISCTDAMNQDDSNGNSISQICNDSKNANIITGTSTYTHPAFTFGDEELTGFWIGKFENSSKEPLPEDRYAIQTPIIKPGLQSWTKTSLPQTFESIRKMEDILNPYGFETSSMPTYNPNTGEIDDDVNNVTPHLLKNMEWGAVAYLSHSKYGRCTNNVCTEIELNPYINTTPYTGGSDTEAGYISNTNQTTTGNIYGVYDMAGGAWEITMGTTMTSVSWDGYNPYNETLNPKYFDHYTSDTINTSYTRGRLGDATIEVTKFYLGSEFPYASSHWVMRGKTNSKIFQFSNHSEVGYDSLGSRSILTVSK